MKTDTPYINSCLSLRPMTEADLDQARLLWEAAEGVELAEGDSVEELRAYLRRNYESSQVAVFDGVIIGALLAGHDGRRGFLYHLAVDKQHQGKGLGRALVQRALDALRQQSVRRVLILVARDNASGRAFWKRCGWDVLEFAEPMGMDL